MQIIENGDKPIKGRSIQQGVLENIDFSKKAATKLVLDIKTLVLNALLRTPEAKLDTRNAHNFTF